VYGVGGKGVGTEFQTSSLSVLMFTLRQNLQTDITNHLVAFIWGFSYCLKFTSSIYTKPKTFNPIISCHNNLERVFRYHLVQTYTQSFQTP